MTVANNYAPLRQLGNGTTTVFTGSWSMLSAAYANVQLESVTTGVRTPVTQGPGANQYQITITSSGFQVTFGTAPSSSYYVDISRVTGLDQTDSYTTSSGFQGQVEENSFDKLTCAVQDAAYNASLGISIPVGEATTTVLPAAAIRASQFLSFDASGNVSVTSGLASVPVSVAMAPVVGATTLTAALTAMGAAPVASPVLAGTTTVTTLKFSGDSSTQTTALRSTNPTYQTFTSGSGTYTTPANVKWLRVRMSGGGGGGSGGSGGGSGNGGAGGTGGNTTFGSSFLTANGGVGGNTNAYGGAGGSVTINAPATGFGTNGSYGAAGWIGNGGTYGGGGSGGVNIMGGCGGGSPAQPQGNGFSGVGGTGAGGGGGAGSSAAQSLGGAGGGAGGFIDVVVPSPSATYSYAVGAAGTAGTAGTNGSAGGAGATGFIFVEEHYNY